jgi:hypothetical protein
MLPTGAEWLKVQLRGRGEKPAYFRDAACFPPLLAIRAAYGHDGGHVP